MKQKGFVDIAMVIGLAVLVVLNIGNWERSKMEKRHQEEMQEIKAEQNAQ